MFQLLLISPSPTISLDQYQMMTISWARQIEETKLFRPFSRQLQMIKYSLLFGGSDLKPLVLLQQLFFFKLLFVSLLNFLNFSMEFLVNFFDNFFVYWRNVKTIVIIVYHYVFRKEFVHIIWNNWYFDSNESLTISIDLSYWSIFLQFNCNEKKK